MCASGGTGGEVIVWDLRFTAQPLLAACDGPSWQGGDVWEVGAGGDMDMVDGPMHMQFIMLMSWLMGQAMNTAHIVHTCFAEAHKCFRRSLCWS